LAGCTQGKNAGCSRQTKQWQEPIPLIVIVPPALEDFYRITFNLIHKPMNIINPAAPTVPMF